MGDEIGALRADRRRERELLRLAQRFAVLELAVQPDARTDEDVREGRLPGVEWEDLEARDRHHVRGSDADRGDHLKPRGRTATQHVREPRMETHRDQYWPPGS